MMLRRGIARAVSGGTCQRRPPATRKVAIPRAAARWQSTPAEDKVIKADRRPEDIVFDPDRNLMEYAGMNGGQIVEKKLREYGVTHVFGFTGGAILPVTDAFYDSPIKFINNASEQCAGHCAEGYAKAGGGLSTGICIATSGPGVTNLITALQDALTDSVPIIAFVGQVPTKAVGSDAFQECPTEALTKPCTKWNYQLARIEELPDIIDKAFYMAHSGKKGPVLVDLPKDIVTQTLDPWSGYKNDQHLVPRIGAPRGKIPNIEAIAKLINQAKKPVIVAGQGANDACEQVRELAIKGNIPVTTTLHALGLFDEAHPLSLKMLGMHGTAYANYAIQDADVVIAMGYRFDDRTTGLVTKYAPEARLAEKRGEGGIIHFDISRRQIGKVVPPTHFVLGDCQHTLEQLLPLIESNVDRTPWLEKIAKDKKKYPLQWTPCTDPTKFKVQEVVSRMDQYLRETGRDKDAIWTTGVGNHQMMTAQFVTWRWPRRMMSSGSLGTMGVGVPYAVGAQIRKPESMVICIDGDASFNMTSNDLRTMAEHNIPVKVAIMNDFRQQMVHIWQTIYFNQRYVVTDSHNPDYCKLADAHGIHSLRVSCRDELEEGIKAFIDYKGGPIIADFRVEPDMCTPMVSPGAGLDDMILDPEEVMQWEINPMNVPS